MLKRADLAMYAAKRAGKGTIRHYSAHLDTAQITPAPVHTE